MLKKFIVPILLAAVLTQETLAMHEGPLDLEKGSVSKHQKKPSGLRCMAAVGGGMLAVGSVITILSALASSRSQMMSPTTTPSPFHDVSDGSTSLAKGFLDPQNPYYEAYLRRRGNGPLFFFQEEALARALLEELEKEAREPSQPQGGFFSQWWECFKGKIDMFNGL